MRVCVYKYILCIKSITQSYWFLDHPNTSTVKWKQVWIWVVTQSFLSTCIPVLGKQDAVIAVHLCKISLGQTCSVATTGYQLV